MIQGSIHQEDITVVNIYACNICVPKYIKQILIDMKGEIDNNTIIIGDFSTPLSVIRKSSRQKINKEMMGLNQTFDQVDLTGIYRTFHPTAAEYTFFLSACGTFSRRDHMIEQKTSLSKIRQLKSYQVSFLFTMV